MSIIDRSTSTTGHRTRGTSHTVYYFMILIGIHGYSSEGEREKSRGEVTIDRCKKTEEVANEENIYKYRE